MHAAQRRWSLSDPVPVAATATSHLFRVTAPSGPAALKLLTDFGADEMAGAQVLRLWDGEGAVRLLAAQDRAMVLEWLEGPALGDLAHAGQDTAATEVLAQVALRLHVRQGPVTGLQPLEERLSPLLGHRPEPWPAPARAGLARAADLAGTLLASALAPQPLHGDLHHDNVLGSARGWLAIDPKGVLGDPAYDLANCFRNPLGAAELALDPQRIVRTARIFADRLHHPPQRLLGWSAAHSALSAIWTAEAGGDPAFDLALLPRLLAAHDAATPATGERRA